MTNHNNEPGCVGIIIILLCVLGICGIKDCLSRTSSEMIKKAKKSQIPMDYVSYLKKYPKGEYAEEALDSILSIIVNDDSPLFKLKATSYIVNTEPIRGSRIEKPIKSYLNEILINEGSDIYWQEYENYSDSADILNVEKGYYLSMKRKASKYKSPYSIVNYIIKYPNGKFVGEALDSILNIIKNDDKPTKNMQSTYKMANSYPIKKSRIEGPIKSFIYESLIKDGTEKDWECYKLMVDSEDLNESDKYLALIKKKNWGTDQVAWKTAKKENTTTSYKRYMDLYPNGKHHNEAKNNYVNLSVKKDIKSEHGELPKISKISESDGDLCIINIDNSTGCELTIFYSGRECEYSIIPKDNSKKIKLKSGNYNVSARVNDKSVRPFVGSECLEGGIYEVTYIITYNHLPNFSK